ncbi:hypothetical protein GIB67_041512 [Kingdonia uniflora]|uniref:Uncharacterized protein n=1 Tax=Kingdonia uniflora TaxID=39325 RepID=A0A7J7MQ89_9MAGN|nr:hypothetical protein GIB67_041512 [Kingdonia uniflora]
MCLLASWLNLKCIWKVVGPNSLCVLNSAIILLHFEFIFLILVGISTFNWTTYELQVSFMARIPHLYLKNMATEEVLTRKDVLPFK